MKEDYYGFLDYVLRIVPRNVLKMYDDTKVANDVPEIMPFFRLWARNATILWLIHISLGIIATILAILITAFSASGSSYHNVIPVLSIIAAIAAALLTSLDIGTKSNNTRNAWRALNLAMMKYNRDIISVRDVIDVYEQGEKLISGVNITLPSTLQQQLVAIIKPDLPTATPGQKILLDASQSIGDKIVSYMWRIVNGNGNITIEGDNSRSTTVIIPSDATPGSSVTISLTVTDSRGMSTVSQKVISIGGLPPSKD